METERNERQFNSTFAAAAAALKAKLNARVQTYLCILFQQGVKDDMRQEASKRRRYMRQGTKRSGLPCHPCPSSYMHGNNNHNMCILL